MCPDHDDGLECTHDCINWWNDKCERLRKSAQRRGLYHDLTGTYLKEVFDRQGGFCALSGMKLGYGGPQGTSIDRIHHDRGYVRGNVRIVTWQVNQGRGRWTDEEFYQMCRNVTEIMGRGFNGNCDVIDDGTFTSMQTLRAANQQKARDSG